MKKVKRLYNEINVMNTKINNKYNNLKNNNPIESKPERYVPTKEIHNYPIIKIQLNVLRKHEMKLSKNKDKREKSFVDLFKIKLGNIPGAREMASIIINVEIDTNEYVESSNKKLKEEFKLCVKEKHNPNEDDEYEIKYEKVMKQSKKLVVIENKRNFA